MVMVYIYISFKKETPQTFPKCNRMVKSVSIGIYCNRNRNRYRNRYCNRYCNRYRNRYITSTSDQAMGSMGWVYAK
jgi:hypothetical protein